jgi:hypothetical protein
LHLLRLPQELGLLQGQVLLPVRELLLLVQVRLLPPVQELLPVHRLPFLLHLRRMPYRLL